MPPDWWATPEERLNYLMDVAIAETDGGEREAVIREFMRCLDIGPTGDPDEPDTELLNELGANETERYQAACELFAECARYGSRPKRDF